MPPPIQYASAVRSWTRPNGTIMSQTVPISAQATLQPNNMTGGSAPAPALTPPGWGSGTCPMHHNRGHLIGNALGGPGNDVRNLVTLVAGTNHPFMYDYEAAVKNFVTAHAARAPFTYHVFCDYDQNLYSACEGFPHLYGGAGNPFCLWPTPARLRIGLTDTNNHVVGIQELFPTWSATDVANFQTHMMTGGMVIILNGIFKLYQSIVHVTNQCWAVTQDPHVLQAAAGQYAQLLGH